MTLRRRCVTFDLGRGREPLGGGFDATVNQRSEASIFYLRKRCTHHTSKEFLRQCPEISSDVSTDIVSIRFISL